MPILFIFLGFIIVLAIFNNIGFWNLVKLIFLFLIGWCIGLFGLLFLVALVMGHN